MPVSWRDQMRSYKDRWLIGLGVALSLLLHIGLVAFFLYGVPMGSQGLTTDDTIDFDLSQIDPRMMQQLQQEQEPDRLHFDRFEANRQKPQKADAYGFQDHNAGQTTHRADRPIEEIQRRPGPSGPGRGSGPAGPGRQAGRRGGGNLPPMPEVGEGVGEPRDRQPSEATPTDAVDRMISRAGMASPPGGGGGENGINPYNPNVGDPGQTLSISTKEYRYMAYFAHMKEKIEMAWMYPVAAQQMGQQGSCTLKFTVLKSGKVQEVKVIRTSGYRLLDQYAVKAVKEAHFNPMPSSWPDESLTIAANFIYKLIGVRTIQ